MSVKPLLYLDVDGVINVHGSHRQLRVLGEHGRVFIPDGVPERLLLLHEHYTIVWATAWRALAPTLLAPKLSLPAWEWLWWQDMKLPAIRTHAAGRPWVWLDDDISYELDTHPAEDHDGLFVEVDGTVGLDARTCRALLRHAA